MIDIKKAIYIVYYINSEDNNDFSWYIAEKENSDYDEALGHLKSEYGDFDKENILDVYRVSDRDILEVANS